ncbi:MAG: DJ-1/PfpI family protein [Chloroflexi bacterium]|nr:DJ-1/PfpI family protein [Chloroflexota bacterium]
MPSSYLIQKSRRTKNFILIGDGFDELEVIYFLHQFRQAGLYIKSVSLFNKLVYSCKGVGLKADYSLADVPIEPLTAGLLILPSGGLNGDALRRDARVKSLLLSMNEGAGQVVVTEGNSLLAEDVDRLVGQRPLLRRLVDQSLDEFVGSLTDRVIYAG